MKKLFVLISFFLLCGFASPPEISVSLPTGAAKYLDADGNGCSNGNTTYDPATATCGAGSATVYTTLENADGNIGAGNILYMRAGTYTATMWNESGSNGSEILITPYNGEVVTIDCLGNTDYDMRFIGNYIILDGGSNKTLSVTNSDWETNPNFMIRVMGDYVTVRRINVTGPSGYCNNTNNTCFSAINDAGAGPVEFKAYNNVLTNCSHKGFYIRDCTDCEVKNNTINHVGNNGIQINPHASGEYVDSIVVSGNAIYDCGDCYSGGGRSDFDSGGEDMAGDGIYLQGTSAGDGFDGAEIYNNLIWDSVQNGIQVDCDVTLSEIIYLYNNTIYSNGSYGIWFASDVTDNYVAVDNNILYSNSSGGLHLNGVTPYTNTNNPTSDPSFVSVDDSNADFLKISGANPGSDTSPPVEIDYFGTTRDASTPDIGAHEYEDDGYIHVYSTDSAATAYGKIEGATAGQTVKIHPGTYQFRVYLDNDGTEGNEITIEAYDSGDKPVFDLDGADCDEWPGSYSAGDLGRGLWQITGDYININNIIFRNSYCNDGACLSNSSGIRHYLSNNINVTGCKFESNDNGIVGYGDDIVYTNCEFDSNGNLVGTDGTHNIYTHGGEFTFRYCYLHDPTDGQNFHSRSREMNFEYCIIDNGYNYTGDIMTDSNESDGSPMTQDVTMIGCLIVENSNPGNDSKAFTTYNDQGGSNITMGMKLYYNTFIGNGNSGAVMRFTNSGLTAQYFYSYNNIYYNKTNPFTFDTTTGVTALSQNDYWPTGDYTADEAYMSDSVFASSPGFVGSGDYSLSAGSDCIDAANNGLGETPSYEITFSDPLITGIARSSVNDLGAYDYGGVSTLSGVTFSGVTFGGN